VVRLGHAEHIGYDKHGERLGVRPNEFTVAGAGDLIDQEVGLAAHEYLVLLEPLGRQKPHDQGALARVRGRIHGHHVLVHRQLVSVAIDDRTHVVTLERHRERGKRPDHRVARGEGLAVEIHIGRLLVPRHGDDAVVRRGQHRALRAQVVVVGVRILEQRLVGEEIDGVVVGHGGPLLCLVWLLLV
jgi:hypothetical protein